MSVASPSASRDEADPRPGALQHHVGRHGRAVQYVVDPVEEGRERQADVVGDRAERVVEPAFELRRRRWHLDGADVPGRVDGDAVGEGAADVDADVEAHVSPFGRSASDEPSVDGHCQARDVARCPARQEEGDVRYLRRLSDPAERKHRDEAVEPGAHVGIVL